jgi:hypothetical protein
MHYDHLPYYKNDDDELTQLIKNQINVYEENNRLIHDYFGWGNAGTWRT